MLEGEPKKAPRSLQEGCSRSAQEGPGKFDPLGSGSECLRKDSANSRKASGSLQEGPKPSQSPRASGTSAQGSRKPPRRPQEAPGSRRPPGRPQEGSRKQQEQPQSIKKNVKGYRECEGTEAPRKPSRRPQEAPDLKRPPGRPQEGPRKPPRRPPKTEDVGKALGSCKEGATKRLGEALGSVHAGLRKAPGDLQGGPGKCATRRASRKASRNSVPERTSKKPQYVGHGRSPRRPRKANATGGPEAPGTLKKGLGSA